MGANQSYETDFADVTNGMTAGDRKERGGGRGSGHDEGSLQKRRKKAKPASPHRPAITAVTNTAISLAWLPPRHSLHAIIAYTVEIRKSQQAKAWTVLTKNCQGTHYEARNLDSDSEYVFRVRAENIFGTGKPSAPSGPVTTKVFESSSDLSCYISHSHSFTSASPISPYIERRPTAAICSTPTAMNVPKSISYDTGLLDRRDSELDTSIDSGMVKSPSLPAHSPNSNSSFGTLSTSNLSINQNQSGNFKRRHSFNVHFDGRISSMLNHSGRFYSTNSLNSSTSTIVMSKTQNGRSNASTSNIYNNNDTDNTKTRSNSTSILRNNTNRSSLQPYRKSSIPILLPGAGSNSLNKLRESRVSLKSSSHDINSGSSCGSATGSLASTSTLTATPRHSRGSLNLNNRRSRECRNSLGSTASDSNTTTSSASSSTKEDYGGGKTSEGSRLSLQSVFSDVTMSTHSQTSSDDSSPSRPISFSDIGENSELASFLNGSSFIDALKTSTTSSGEEGSRSPLDNEQSPNKNAEDYYDINRVHDEIDDIYRLKHDLKNMEITEEKLKFHDLKERLKIGGINSEESCLISNSVSQKDYYQTLDNPWEKDTDSVNRVSENIMAAPYSDDIKIALNATNYGSDDVNTNEGYQYQHHNQYYNNNNNNHNHHYNRHRSANQVWGSNDGGDCDGDQDRDDFRTLRSVLQSNNMIVKQARSMPEVVGVVLGEGGDTRTLTRGKLTTIEDEDEEEETVRITTL